MSVQAPDKPSKFKYKILRLNVGTKKSDYITSFVTQKQVNDYFEKFEITKGEVKGIIQDRDYNSTSMNIVTFIDDNAKIEIYRRIKL